VSPDLSSVVEIGATIILALLVSIALYRSRRSASEPHALQRIERIRAYRERHAVSLRDAARAIAAQDAGQPLPVPAPLRAVSQDVEALVRAGQVIEAIKLYREQTGASLVDAKQAIDRLRN
jgi:ribosomal protein L7/L12